MESRESNYLAREIGFQCKDGMFTMKISGNGFVRWVNGFGSNTGFLDFIFQFPNITRKEMKGLLITNLHEVMSLVEGRVTRRNSVAIVEERLKHVLQV